MSNLIMFYGKECPHCHVMMPLVEKLEQEENIEFTKYEVWHNEENAEKMREYKDQIIPACGGQFGVPAFINKDSKEALCGEQPYETLKEWTKK